MLVRARNADGGVRIDYRATPPEGVPVARWAVCRFGPARDLVAVTTDRGALPESRLFLLKHYYIETPEGAAADPGPPPPDADLPEVPGWAAPLLQHAVLGLPGATTYGLLAAAYALVFGLVGRVNLAFGDIAAVGAAVAGLATAILAIGDPARAAAGIGIGLLLAPLASALHNAVAGHASFVLVPAGRTQASLIATLGLSLALSEYLRLTGSATPNWIPPIAAEPIPIARAGDFVVTLTAAAILTGLVGTAACAGLLVSLARSRFGREWRAGADEPVAAALCGVDGPRLLRTTLAVSGALAGLAGALVAVRFGALGFADGFGLGLKALAAAILGGIGSVGGAVAGGLAIGAFETLWSVYFPIEGRDLALDLALVGAIMLCPDGIAGRARTAAS